MSCNIVYVDQNKIYETNKQRKRKERGKDVGGRRNEEEGGKVRRVGKEERGEDTSWLNLRGHGPHPHNRIGRESRSNEDKFH